MTGKVLKICGLKTTEAASKAIDSGANLLGVIMVPNRARTVDSEVAKQIASLCKKERERRHVKFIDSKELMEHLLEFKTDDHTAWFEYASQLIQENGPYLVGVFRNQSIETINEALNNLALDIVQLHGSEDIGNYIQEVTPKVPIIPRILLNDSREMTPLTTHKFLLPLLDSELGGEGNLIDWDQVNEFGKTNNGRYLLAGGLTPENVGEGLGLVGCLGVDVSGGVETNGVKDLTKIEAFLINGRK